MNKTPETPSSDSSPELSAGPLTGIRILEMGQFIAGPFTGSILAYYGADVIKIEPPGNGDPIRNWRTLKDGTSLWWRSIGRNKKSVTLNLREEKGRDIARNLAGQCDVLIENFRPGTMEKWGLGPDDMKAINPGLVYSRISGYGQTGPYSSKPGFASACEAIGGFRYLNGFPGEAPVRPNLSMGDTLASLHAVIGTLLALIHRGKVPDAGQVVDTAIYESVFNMMESLVPEYDVAGVVREPSGTTLTGIVPTNTYRCSDDKFVVIGANADPIFQRLMRAADRPEMAEDPRLADNVGRVTHQKEIDDAIGDWTATLTLENALKSLDEAGVPCGPIYSVADMFDDPHFQARGLFERVDVDGETMTIPAITPQLEKTPGRTRWAGVTEPGAHNHEVLVDWLGLSEADLEQLKAANIV